MLASICKYAMGKSSRTACRTAGHAWEQIQKDQSHSECASLFKTEDLGSAVKPIGIAILNLDESWRSFKQMRKETLLVFQDFFCSGADPPRPIQAAALVFLTITKSNSVAFVKDEMKATCQIFVICVLYLSKTLLVGSFVSLCPWPLSKHTWLDFLVSNLVLNCAESS